jgi:hypothetical protein
MELPEKRQSHEVEHGEHAYVKEHIAIQARLGD